MVIGMRLYENEAKRIFEKEDISIPRQYGLICRAEDLTEMQGSLEFPMMMKSLVLIGGRGKAGGIKKTTGLEEAVVMAGDMLGKEIRGYKVEMLMLEEAVEEKVAFVPGTAFYADGRGHDALRLTFATCPTDMIDEGIRRLGNAIARRTEKAA